MCMIGGIYSDQRCPVCSSTFKDDGKKSLKCPNHNKIVATRFSARFKSVHQRFNNYDNAKRFLEGLRFKYDEGNFDDRDYRKNKPLGFSTLIEKWIERKKQEVKPKNYNNLKNYASKASAFFADTNIKDIGYPELEDFKYSLSKLSSKTQKNYIDALHTFWEWLRKCKYISMQDFPEFPSTDVEIGYRKTIDKETQIAILNEVKKLTANYNPKIWFAIKLLSTYISIRPGELISLEEGNIDLGNGYLYFPKPKEKKYKAVPLIDEDIEIFRSFPRGLPNLRFLRHTKGSGRKAGSPFGQHVLSNWWKKACKNIGVNGVDLYGGTRHSSARALRKAGRSPEEIKKASGHHTNKAFERYFRIEADDLREIYKDASGKEVVKNLGHIENANQL